MDRRLLLARIAALVALAAALAPAQAQTPPAPEVPGSFLKGSPKVSPAVRERLVELLQLPKDKLWAELVKWPAFQQMSLQEQAAFLQRLAEMHQRLRTQALKKAADMGLKLSPEEEDAFVASYLKERLEVERQMWQETQPKRRKLEEQLTTDLRQQYGDAKTSSASSPPASAVATAPPPTSPR